MQMRTKHLSATFRLFRFPLFIGLKRGFARLVPSGGETQAPPCDACVDSDRLSDFDASHEPSSSNVFRWEIPVLATTATASACDLEAGLHGQHPSQSAGQLWMLVISRAGGMEIATGFNQGGDDLNSESPSWQGPYGTAE
jgi:hypothetical protein